MISLSRTGVLMLGLSLSWPLAAESVTTQIHGFGAQAFILTDHHNYAGDSTNGSTEFFEFGVNASARLNNELLVSAQALIRDAGGLDTGKPRVDFALVDWRPIDGRSMSAGIRAGRVKNRFGFFNDTRDVVFTRPGIFLPQSVYLEGFGFRDLLFSSDGAQFYADFSGPDFELNLSSTWAVDRALGRKESQVLNGRDEPIGDFSANNVSFFQVLGKHYGGVFQWALSRAGMVLSLKPATNSNSFGVDAEIDAYVISARINRARWSLISEYQFIETRLVLLGPTLPDSAMDGAYVQLDYRHTNELGAFVRIDSRFIDRNDRDGRRAIAAGQLNRTARFSHDITVGMSWKFRRNWGVWAEVHRIYGTATVPALDNPVRDPATHWALFSLMLGFHF